MKKLFLFCLAFALIGPAQADLFDRGGGLIYDDVQDITWMQDANYVVTGGYDADGLMTWWDALKWAEDLTYYDAVRGVVWDDWRLPRTTVPDSSCSEQQDAGPEYPPQGLAYNCTGSEMGYLYNVYGITHTAQEPFINIQKFIYWSETGYEPNDGRAWWFVFGLGGWQGHFVKPDTLTVWAVRDGDVAAETGPLEVEIDVRPFSPNNVVNPRSKGKLPVLILSTDSVNDTVNFDATQVDVTTVVLGENAFIAHRNGHIGDIDNDGDDDLMAHFRVSDTGVVCGDTSISISGKTYAGEEFVGTAAIVTPKGSCR